MQQVQTAYLCGKKDFAFGISKPCMLTTGLHWRFCNGPDSCFKECGSVDSAKILEKAVSMSSSALPAIETSVTFIEARKS